MSITLRGTIRYDGSAFHGWQRQPGARTVQGVLETALSRIASEPVTVQGAGRTDAGVHALGQVFSCRWPKPLHATLRHALCVMLGPEVRVTDLREADESFNARFSAIGKKYAYSLEFAPEADPFASRHAWHVPYTLDLDLLRSLLPRVTGERDFAGFQSTGSQMKSTVRTLHSVQLLRGGVFTPCDNDRLWRIEYHGDGFLYKMVRNLTGTLIEITRGRFPREFLDECLHSGGPFRGHCAPAHGLALVEVYYPPDKQPNAP